MDIACHVEAELEAARVAEFGGDLAGAFHHLERAHILGQNVTSMHVQAHVRMLGWAWRRRDWREFRGQILRIVGAATKTVFGWVPQGNSGGANVSPFKPMPVPDDLARMMRDADR